MCLVLDGATLLRVLLGDSLLVVGRTERTWLLVIVTSEVVLLANGCVLSSASDSAADDETVPLEVMPGDVLAEVGYAEDTWLAADVSTGLALLGCKGRVVDEMPAAVEVTKSGVEWCSWNELAVKTE